VSGIFLARSSWVGLENYRRLFDDELLIPAFGRTFKFVALGVLPTVFGGFLVAVLLNWKVKGIGAFRAMFFFPLTISSAVAGIAWSSIFNPEAGWINRILEIVGIKGPEWLSSFTWALPSSHHHCYLALPAPCHHSLLSRLATNFTRNSRSCSSRWCQRVAATMASNFPLCFSNNHPGGGDRDSCLPLCPI
jgi:ABC-type spermidine/putrescine transport system permease subunit I